MSASMRRRAGGLKSVKDIQLQTNRDASEPEPEPVTQPWTPGAYTAFKIIMSARLCAAAWNIVGDCDETYNYWEPTHYLMFGKGFQTWEYSPQYAIRSYAYIFLHTLPMRLYTLLFGQNKIMLFFFLRCVMAFACALCEIYFYKGVCKHFGSNTGRIMLCFLLLSAGMFISCTAYLPSSFCMYMTYLALGGWFLEDYRVTVLSTAASAIIGWPFAVILGVPMALDIVIWRKQLKLFVMWSAIALVVFLVPVVEIDKYYYGRLVIAPLNIVLYNVFTEHGPDLYGVEPLSFYFINGFLNFNIAFLLALICLPLVITIQNIVKSQNTDIPAWLFTAPLYLWIAVFFTRPHKEERFLFPIYPFFILLGAVSVDYIQKFWSWLFPSKEANHYTDNTLWIPVFGGVVFSLLSVSRIVALYQGYHAPLDLFVELNRFAADSKIHTLPPDKPVHVCMGKEWYRFPSSFYLPGDNWSLHFLRSEFKGQLPKPYSSGPDATKIIPSDMNDLNKEEMSRYTNNSRCHYLVDLDLPKETELEPRYAANLDEWKVLASIKFLDVSRSHRFFRAFYVPFVSSKFCVYEDYNLLRTTRSKKTYKSKTER
ncbi:hypothetical protein CHS0354_005879 [Potamilus streckersoni]|uniref:Mannosyltransferase n=1 Tax=Potamilus streckersoni TaxID=2493646 RepID=A0AAE0T893_9BIVA|nr:hypothetical protein CHS0354_005879 [Potamilus streckersoni]